MRFNYNGKVYSIEFRREHDIVTVINKLGEAEEVTSKYPTTRVALAEVVEGKKSHDWPELVSARVNCLVTDKFTLEAGRLYALRKLSEKLSTELRELVWNTYMGRPREPKKIDRLEAENTGLKKQIKLLEEAIALLKREE